MTLTEAITWARDAAAGDYLVRYADTDDEDPGSRCGFGDDDLDEIGRVLRGRDLRLQADDLGLVAQEQ